MNNTISLIKRTPEEVSLYYQQLLLNNYISKQRVKEAILKELEDWRDDLTNWNKEEIPVDFANCLLRRLELEDLK